MFTSTCGSSFSSMQCVLKQPMWGKKNWCSPYSLGQRKDDQSLLICYLGKFSWGDVLHLVPGCNASQREFHEIQLSLNTWLNYIQSLNVYYVTSICFYLSYSQYHYKLWVFSKLSIKIHQVSKGYLNTLFPRGSERSVYNSDKEKMLSAYLAPWSREQTPGCWPAQNCADIGIST